MLKKILENEDFEKQLMKVEPKLYEEIQEMFADAEKLVPFWERNRGDSAMEKKAQEKAKEIEESD